MPKKGAYKRRSLWVDAWKRLRKNKAAVVGMIVFAIVLLAFVAAYPVYGYQKSENDKNQLVIDEYPASIVCDIFRMKIEGMSALKIAEALNNLGVLSPMEYKKSRGLHENR